MFVNSSILKHKRIQKLLLTFSIVIISLIIITFSFQKQSSKIFKHLHYYTDRHSPYYSGSDRNSKDEAKMEFIKGMILHAYNGYKTYSWGADELNPISETSHNWYTENTFLMTPVDILDTLHIIGAKKEFDETRKLILKNLNFSRPVTINAFEINIRIIGGLLSGYELSGDMELFLKAKELADKMMGIFNTKSGIPVNSVTLNSNESIISKSYINLAEAGTFILEWQYLSDISGESIYAKKAVNAMEQILSIPKNKLNLYSNDIDTSTMSFLDNDFGLAGGADSFYEYLLKHTLSTEDPTFKDAYYEVVDALATHIVTVSADGKNVYCPNRSLDHKQSTFHHLSCFAGGMFSMGALANRKGNWTKHLDLGRRMTETCYRAYNTSSSSVGFESVFGDTLATADYGKYLQRPETVESIFYMWRFTHDPKYREWGWEIAQAIENKLRNGIGYHGMNDFATPNDRMESFFLAETLKYLYLLFADDDTMPLEEYVFNTEAHPISIRGFGKRNKLSKPVAQLQRKVQPMPIDKYDLLVEKVMKGALAE